MRNLTVITLFLLLLITAFPALATSVFEQSIAYWKNERLRIENIIVQGTPYWAEFEYDPVADEFALASYGRMEEGATYCRAGFLGMGCDIARLEVLEHFPDRLRANLVIGRDKVLPIEALCFNGQCSVNLSPACLLEIRFRFPTETSVYIDLHLRRFDDRTCLSLLLYEGPYYRASESELLGSSIPDPAFIDNHPYVENSMRISINGDQVCFGSGFGSVCYRFDPERLSFVKEGLDAVSLMETYGAVCNVPFVIFPASAGENHHIIFGDNRFLYVIELKACSSGPTYVGLSLRFEEDATPRFLGFLTPELNFSSEPVPFGTSEEKIFISTLENPIPGALIRELRENGVVEFSLDSRCTPDPTSIVENKHFDVRSTEI